MSLTAEQIEYVIREVIRRLKDADAVKPTTSGGELVLADRLVTLRDLEGRLMNVRKVTVASRAVVTPAVRDLLREKKIEFVRRANS